MIVSTAARLAEESIASAITGKRTNTLAYALTIQMYYYLAKAKESPENRTKARAALQQYEKAISYARRWVGLDPLHELAQRALITTYHQAGQRSTAVRQYEGLVNLLQKELLQAPEKETLALSKPLKKTT